MFRPLTMQRVALQTLSEDTPVAALVLAECGVFNPETRHVFADQLPDFPGESYRELYHNARSRLDKILAHCASHDEPPLPALRKVDEKELAQLDEWLRTVWLECSKCQEGLRKIEEEKHRIDQLLKTLDNFATLDIDLGLLARSKRFLDVHIGTVPIVNVTRLQEAVGLAGYLLTPFMHGDGVQHVVVAGATGKENEVRPVLQAAGWRAANIPPELHDRPEKVRHDLDKQLERIKGDTASQCLLMERTQQEFNDKLINAEQTLSLAAPYAELGEALRGRGGLAHISGWVPKKDLRRMRERLHSQFGNRFVLSARPPTREERAYVPSVIRHHWLVRPFAALVANYGVPRYGEIDPTWMFALSFIAMFGMMFGDIGHGAVIFIAGLLFRRRLLGFAPFIVFAGLASMLFGWLYGSIFGFEDVVHAMWMSPMSDPILMLTLALYWGIGFILVANLLTIYNRLVDRQYLEALFDGKGLAGMMFYVGLLYGLHRRIDSGVFGATEGAAILLPLAFILGYKWHAHQADVGERILVTLIEGIETLISYFANTLSFLRVAAFSLNHVALALAVFTLAGMMQTTGHWITVVLGNVFILVLEGAIVMIQALRLEYYEGFSRFFNGDGREFRPLTLSMGTISKSQ
ncbi:MAG: V-type ATP synthase subunit I [Sulfuricaulis sp.]